MLIYIMFSYLMLLTALFNVVCLCNAYLFSAIELCKCFLFSCHCHWVTDTVCLFKVLFCIIYSALNQLVFLILCSHRFL